MAISKFDEHSLDNLLQQGLEQLKINADVSQRKQILNYIKLLLKWNSAYNLVATHNAKEILISHILDSLSIVPFIESGPIIDVGSGAGFPGVPLAILFPQYQFTLIDSVGKKTHFLTQLKIELGLKNITVVQGRSENFQPSHCYQLVVSRAVSSIENLVKKTQHLLCPSGKILVMKGQIPEQELENLPWKYEISPLTVPHLFKERHLVTIYL